MGTSEVEMPTKIEKPSSPPPLSGETNVPVYPDWSAIQAYYGAGIPLPPPYFNPAIAAGHPPHPYMWGPQPMMPPYGSPYAAMYPHGGMYAHPSLSLGAHGHGVPPSPAIGEAMASPVSKVTPSKSTTSAKDQGSKKKLKASNGLTASMGTGDGNGGTASRPQSEGDGIAGSSEGSDGNTEAGEDRAMRKRSHAGTPSTEAKKAHNKLQRGSGNSSGVSGKQLEAGFPQSMPPALGLMDSSTGKRTTVPPTADISMPAHAVLPSDLWMKDERALKREKRKQSNRESARRSRLKKQAESEELALKVESLNVENAALRSEISHLNENSEKLRIENNVLTEKLKNAQLRQSEERLSDKTEEHHTAPFCTENFLSRVHNSDPVAINQNMENGVNENLSSGAKLHQLLESSPRADAVATG